MATWLKALLVVAVLSSAIYGDVSIKYEKSDSYSIKLEAADISGYLSDPFSSFDRYESINFNMGQIVSISGEIYSDDTDANAVLGDLTSQEERDSPNYIKSGKLKISDGDFGVRVDFLPTLSDRSHFVALNNWTLLLIFRQVSNTPRFVLTSQALKIVVSDKVANGTKNENYVALWATPSDQAFGRTDWWSDYSGSRRSCFGYECSRSKLAFNSKPDDAGLVFRLINVAVRVNTTSVANGVFDCYRSCAEDNRPPSHQRSHSSSWNFPSLSHIVHWLLLGTAITMVSVVLMRWRREWKERVRQQAQESRVAYFTPTHHSNSANPASGDALPPLYIIPPPQYSVHSNVGATDAEKSDANELQFV